MLKRTPLLGIVFGGVIAFIVAVLIEEPDRSFTATQTVVLFVLSCLPGMGLAMLLDPYPKKQREEYLKINFYEEKH